MNRKKLAALIRRSVEIYTKHEMGIYGGNTTFYLMISFVPMMMMVISLVNILPWFSVLDVSNLFLRVIPDIPLIRNELIRVLSNLNHQSGTLTASLFALTFLWSGSHGITALMEGLEKINHTQNIYIRDKAKSILYAVLFCFLIPSMFIFQMLRKSLQDIISQFFENLALPDVGVRVNQILKISGIVTLLAMVLIIVMTYTYLPAGKRRIRDQLPGSILTCVLWVLFTNGFGFFIREFWTLSSVYGTLASIFLASMWLKFMIMFLFCGASLNRAIQVESSADTMT